MRTEREGEILVVTIDHPPVNALNVDVRRGLLAAVQQAQADASVRAVLIVGAGRAFIAVRDNDNAAEVIGINVFYYKTLAFFIGAFYAGVAGGVLGYFYGAITPEYFALTLSIFYLAAVIVGGLGSVLGSVLGSGLGRCIISCNNSVVRLYDNALKINIIINNIIIID